MFVLRCSAINRGRWQKLDPPLGVVKVGGLPHIASRAGCVKLRACLRYIYGYYYYHLDADSDAHLFGRHSRHWRGIK